MANEARGAVSVTAPKPGDKPKPNGKVRSIRIEPADGGFIVNVDRESKGGPAMDMPKPYVCKDQAECLAYVGEQLGDGAAPAPPRDIRVTESPMMTPPSAPPADADY